MPLNKIKMSVSTGTGKTSDLILHDVSDWLEQHGYYLVGATVGQGMPGVAAYVLGRAGNIFMGKVYKSGENWLFSKRTSEQERASVMKWIHSGGSDLVNPSGGRYK